MFVSMESWSEKSRRETSAHTMNQRITELARDSFDLLEEKGEDNSKFMKQQVAAAIQREN